MKNSTQRRKGAETQRPKEKRVVVCAAIRSNATGQIICGARHWDEAMRSWVIKDGKRPKEWVDDEQGFIDQHCRFLTRRQAWKIADAAGQIKTASRFGWTPGTLFSEDLY